MSVPVTTIYLQSFTWNSVSWNAAGGGPIRGEYDYGGDELPDQTSDAFWATFLAIVNGRAHMRITVREVKQILTIGTKSTGVMTLVGKANSVLVTGANMVLIECQPGEQGRATAGSATLRFGYESADGTTAPFS